MPTIEINESSAGTAINTDIASGARGSIEPVPRILDGMAVLGSAAVGDAAVNLYLGDTFVGTYRNTSTSTAPDLQKDVQPIGYVLSPNEAIRLLIADASGTTALRCVLYTRNLR